MYLENVRELLGGQVYLSDNVDRLENCDVIIECSCVENCMNNLQKYVKLKKPLIIAVTGFSDEDKCTIKEAAKNIPILISSNFSKSIYLYLECIKLTVRNISENDSIWINEYHHIYKKDKPSGTALLLKERIEKELKVQLKNEIQINSIRIGEITGKHEVYISVNNEVICFIHEAGSRKVFAEGILAAAEWACTGIPIRLYNDYEWNR